MNRRNVPDHADEQLQDVNVILEVFSPGDIVHVLQGNLDFAPNSEQAILVIFGNFPNVLGEFIVFDGGSLSALEGINASQRGFVQVKNTVKGLSEGEYGTFQALQQSDACQPLNTFFTVKLAEHGIAHVATVFLLVLVAPGWQDKIGRQIDHQRQLLQLLVDFRVVDG